MRLTTEKGHNGNRMRAWRTCALFCALSLLLGAPADAAITNTLTIASSSHTKNVSSTNSDITLSWNAATTGSGGSITYEYVLNQTATLDHASFTTALATTNTSTLKTGTLTNSTAKSFTGIVDGTFYFHLRAYDSQGIVFGTAVTTFGAIILDSAPTLAASPITPATGDHKQAIQVTITGTKFITGATVDLVNGMRDSTALANVALTSVTVVTANSITATIPANTAPGLYDLRVTNGAPHNKQVSAVDKYTSTNQLPVANAGSDQALTLSGGNVTLNLSGTGTDADSDTIASYSWTTDTDPSAALAATFSGATKSFVLNTAGTYVFSLVVNDGFANSSADSVTVTVSSSANNPPTANAGIDQTVTPLTQVTLNGGSSTDADGTITTYAWSLTSKPGTSSRTIGTASITQANISQPTATFTPDVAGSYTISLTVTDDDSATSTADTMIITANTRPVANAGPDQTVVKNSQVTLTGLGSTDADSNPLTYLWSLSVPNGSSATLSSTTAAQPTFTPNVAGAYTATLSVNDGIQNSAASDSVVVTANTRPVASATADDTSVTTSTLVTLNGTASSDADAGEILTYLWSLSSVPNGSSAVLSSTTASQPTFTPDLAGDYVASLTVSDGKHSSASAATVTVTAADPNATTTHSYTFTKNIGTTSVTAMGFVLDGTGYSTAAQLYAAIPNIDGLSKWDAPTQSYVSFVPGPNLNNFALTPGEAYFVSVSANSSLDLTGTSATITYSFTKNNGTTSVTAIGLEAGTVAGGTTNAAGIYNAITNIDGLSIWDASSQSYVSFVPGPNLNNFSLADGAAYFISVSANSSW